jgi:Cu(I)/Ag(I) efflux system membrane fusion protein
MRLAGMTDDQIRLVTSSGRAQPRITIASPIAGVIAELSAREGMTVMAGTPLFRINGLSTIWVNAEVPENVAAQIRPGDSVQARTAALPGKVFIGKVSAILPQVNTTTRTIDARIELTNLGGRLVPGMFVNVALKPAAHKEVLLIPSEAVIATGTRSVVMIDEGDGKFKPVDVETGSEADGQTEIRKGLEVGQKVVVSGQFLIDSEASLKGTTIRISDMPGTDNSKAQAPASKEPTHHGVGKVEKIDKEEITISHGPIPSLQWGPMTMGFKLPSSGLPRNIAVGDNVAFDIRQTKDGMFEIVSISPTAEAPMQNDSTMGAPK